MTGFDYGALAVLGLSLLLGVARGFVRELVSLGGWVAAFVLAMAFGRQVAALMPQSLGPLLAAFIGFALVFISVLIVAGFIGLALGFLVRKAGLGFGDRVLGAVFGLARGVAIVLALVLLAGLTPLPQEPFWRNASLSGPFETAAVALRPFLPEGLARHLKYR